MLKHVIRIGPPWLRCPLLLAVWPASFVRGLCTVPDGAIGRHCALSVAIFWAAWDGAFVPE